MGKLSSSGLLLLLPAALLLSAAAPPGALRRFQLAALFFSCSLVQISTAPNGKFKTKETGKDRTKARGPSTRKVLSMHWPTDLSSTHKRTKNEDRTSKTIQNSKN